MIILKLIFFSIDFLLEFHLKFLLILWCWICFLLKPFFYVDKIRIFRNRSSRLHKFFEFHILNLNMYFPILINKSKSRHFIFSPTFLKHYHCTNFIINDLPIRNPMVIENITTFNCYSWNLFQIFFLSSFQLELYKNSRNQFLTFGFIFCWHYSQILRWFFFGKQNLMDFKKKYVNKLIYYFNDWANKDIFITKLYLKRHSHIFCFIISSYINQFIYRNHQFHFD